MDILLVSCLPFALPMWCRLEWAQCRSRRCRSWVRCAGPLAFPWLFDIFFSLKANGYKAFLLPLQIFGHLSSSLISFLSALNSPQVSLKDCSLWLLK
jgi:hypothetical protein